MIYHASDHEQTTTPADDFAARIAAAKFDTGTICNSAEVADFIAGNLDEGALIEIGHCLLCHISGDWGDLDDEDKQANEDALTDGSRIFSAYLLPSFDRLKIWIITEAADDKGRRSATTILFPSEY
jgi:hypothetical protein